MQKKEKFKKVSSHHYFLCAASLDITSYICVGPPMKVVVQNLQKKNGLATVLVETHKPDVMLLQEININSENEEMLFSSNTSIRGYGTAIYSKEPVSRITQIQSPYAEFGGFIFKKTIIATTAGVQYVSFHGYNGQPFKDVSKLVAHIDAVLSVISPTGPVIFAGDFNTWSVEHFEAIKTPLESAGFSHSYSWPYPGRETPLDHVFLRGVELKDSAYFSNESDHLGAVLELSVQGGPPIT
mmetsp:Transcript_202/g.220  ORF Transcript_202/g.220 Transcript_202/m.220 type:complete len:240 (-) Transcript_202:272-991(-)